MREARAVLKYWGFPAFGWLRIPGAALAVDQFSVVRNPFSEDPGPYGPAQSAPASSILNSSQPPRRDG